MKKKKKKQFDSILMLSTFTTFFETLLKLCSNLYDIEIVSQFERKISNTVNPDLCR